MFARDNDFGFGIDFELDGTFFAEDADRDAFWAAWTRKFAVVDGFDVGVNFAVEHVDNAGGVGCERGVMSDHDNGVALSMNIAEFFHDNMAAATIEVAGRLVGKNDGWF